jgi:hypothetical protein
MELFQKLWIWLTGRKKPVPSTESIELTEPVEALPTTYTPKQKGEMFEHYVVHKFDPRYFKLRAMRSEKVADGVYPESNSYPDVTLEYKPAKQSFAVECKWRQAWQARSNQNQFINWAGGTTKLQGLQKMKNYYHYATTYNLPVFVVIGIGGSPDLPEELYVVPLQSLKAPLVDKPYLSQFRKYNIQRNFFFDAQKKTLT